MAVFGRDRKQPAHSTRDIPTLNPGFYRSVHKALLRNGGSDSEGEIAAGVANAIFNTGRNYLDRVDDRRGLRDFEDRFGFRDAGDRDSADEMLDWLIGRDPGTQDFLGTLLGRLQDVLSRPAS